MEYLKDQKEKADAAYEAAQKAVEESQKALDAILGDTADADAAKANAKDALDLANQNLTNAQDEQKAAEQGV